MNKKEETENKGTMNNNSSYTKELADALLILSCGQLTYPMAQDLADKYDVHSMLKRYSAFNHKGINWIAKEILKGIGIVPEDYSWNNKIEDVAIIRKVAQDESLTLDAKGLFSVIYHFFKENSKVSKKEIFKSSKEDKEDFNKTWNELKEKGYLDILGEHLLEE